MQENKHVSLLESIIAGKRHCGTFIDNPFSDIDKETIRDTQFFYMIPQDIAFSGVLDLNQLNPVFNSFPILTRNKASFYLLLWVQDFFLDLKIVLAKQSRYYIILSSGVCNDSTRETRHCLSIK
ncbi:MAG: hypothetical protein EZS28_041406 [Streblomastix strix]|uniref:Uncharacterized protein n=1 Tax=Streblomastix strix TaxID=222440 RepID=A0A5J4TX53_9EUKA|nr:MAG: hypothetical protein EZS28_041406 [Streblomastix strix]